jgi:hypothetical protein
MKNVKLILLVVTAMLFLGMSNVNAQESSSVMITTITTGRQITLQVVDDQNTTISQEYKFSKNNPEQAILKIEMDKWIKNGYSLSQSYGYVAVYPGTVNIATRYETVILTKKE